MEKRDSIISRLNAFLNIDKISDHLPKGLLIEGTPEVYKIVTGVSASLELFRRAAGAGAQMVIVHHGLFWENDSPVLKGSLKQRVKTILDNNITLLGYHLPLDCHPRIGNNAAAARALGLKQLRPFGSHNGTNIGFKGLFHPGMIAAQVFERIKDFYGCTKPLIIPAGPGLIRKVGIVSGGAAANFKDAIREKLDLYITGEPAENVVQLAREENIHFVAAGHYATERAGIIALTNYVNKNFKVKAEFIDVPVPV